MFVAVLRQPMQRCCLYHPRPSSFVLLEPTSDCRSGSICDLGKRDLLLAAPDDDDDAGDVAAIADDVTAD